MGAPSLKNQPTLMSHRHSLGQSVTHTPAGGFTSLGNLGICYHTCHQPIDICSLILLVPTAFAFLCRLTKKKKVQKHEKASYIHQCMNIFHTMDHERLIYIYIFHSMDCQRSPKTKTQSTYLFVFLFVGSSFPFLGKPNHS